MSENLIELLRSEKPQAIVGSHATAGDATVLITREHLLDVMRFMRDDPRCKMDVLVDVTAADWLEYPLELRHHASPCDPENPAGWTSETLPRFEVVYHLLSMPLKHRLRVKVPVHQDDARVPTLTSLWIAADWGEREAWDMVGVRFEGHPDLRRMLMYEEFEGHPLRRDYPLRGYQPLVAMPELVHYTDHETFR